VNNEPSLIKMGQLLRVLETLQVARQIACNFQEFPNHKST